MSLSAWSNLPNATSIDRIITSAKMHSGIWCTEFKINTFNRNNAWNGSLEKLHTMHRYYIWDSASDTVNVNSSNSNRHLLSSTWNAILGLIAYDDCSYMLDADADELKILSALGDIKAILLLPACMKLAKIKELQSD